MTKPMKKAIDIQQLVRENVRKLKPYSSARSEFKGKADIFLDANENPYPNTLTLNLAEQSEQSEQSERSEQSEQSKQPKRSEQPKQGKPSPLNRYPDPLQKRLKAAIGEKLVIDPGQLFLGNGSDEAIDLLFRAFCEPGQDRALICSPTYGMYQVSAGINNIELVDIPLTNDFQPDIPSIRKAIDQFSPKLIFLCSPNNPTGNAMERAAVEDILQSANGLVVVDEAYADFAPDKSYLKDTTEWPHLVVLKTFSKAWGMAGLRLGMAVANPEIIAVMNKIKPPYNLSSLVQDVALEKVLGTDPQIQIDEITSERNRLQDALVQMEGVLEVFPSDANFLLVRFEKAGEIFNQLRDLGIVIRDRRAYVDDALRITVGTPTENQALLYQIETIFSRNISIH